MDVILVTGGVHADVGKGCAAAVIGRMVARAGRTVTYRKLEPCIQSEIVTLSNRHFGEIVASPAGAFDGDVARAAFLIPGFVPGRDADLSLGRALARLLERTEGDPAPRLRELASVYRGALSCAAEVAVIEVGGTVGEPEHALVTDALVAGVGRPALHLHVTALVEGTHGRMTTKPAQTSVAATHLRPDIVLVRRGVGADLRALADSLPSGTPVIPVADDPLWPERAHHGALMDPACVAAICARLAVTLGDDPLFPRASESIASDVQVVDDGVGAVGYGSLVRRLVTWSGGRMRPRFVDRKSARPDLPLVRIGESSVPAVATAPGTPRIDIVPVETQRDPRDATARPDWLGTADRPEGAVADFVRHGLTHEPSSVQGGSAAYADPAFAKAYLEAGSSGRLRDHAPLDPLIRAALPSRRRLRGARVLDLGCGDGRWAARLLEEGVGHVIGVEPGGPMADQAIARRLPGLTVLRCRAEEVELDGEFDAALAIMSLDHVQFVADALERSVAHVRPHARFIIAVEHPLRSAPRAGGRWMSEDDGTRAARVRDYGIEGWRTFSWFDPPFPVSVYHRPLGAWVDLIRNAGLDLLAVREPISNDPRDAGVPRAVLLIAERPGPKTRLVVIDGPSGAGKTSVGDEVAVRLGWVHLDTGRIARAFGLRERSGLGRDAIVAVRVEGCAARVLLNGDDVTSMLSTPEIGSATAMVLADRTVEAEYDELVFHQIARLESTGCVVTGRGMGRELPQAVVRAWLDVPHGVRAARSGHAALDRDRTDRDRGRLEDVDPGSIRIDGTRAVADVAAVVTRLVHTRVGS